MSTITRSVRGLVHLGSVALAATSIGGCGGEDSNMTTSSASSTGGIGGDTGSGGDGGSAGSQSGAGGSSSNAGGAGGGGGAPVHYTCTVQLGSGSGQLKITSAEAHDGDVVCVAAGTYSGADLEDLTNVVIIPAGPLVFTGGWDIHHTQKVTVDGTVLDGKTYGITFQGFDGFAFETGATNNRDLTLKGIELDSVSGVDGNNQGNITYDGTVETLLFSNLVMDTFKATGGHGIFLGTYQGLETFHNVTIGLVLRNIVVENDANRGPNMVNGGSIYDYVLDHWTITGTTKNTNIDEGIFSITGNGTVSNIFRNGGWGYIGRMIIAGLGKPTDFYGYNIIDVNGQNYGTFDLRGANVMATPSIYSGNIHLYNITSGNKITANTYISPIVIIYGLGDFTNTTYDADLENCFVFDNQRDPHNYPTTSTLLVQFGPANVHSSHNVEVNGAVGSLPSGYLVDQTKFYPAPGGKLIGGGATVALTKKDIYGESRGSKYDIGAVQHQ